MKSDKKAYLPPLIEKVVVDGTDVLLDDPSIGQGSATDGDHGGAKPYANDYLGAKSNPIWDNEDI